MPWEHPSGGLGQNQVYHPGSGGTVIDGMHYDAAGDPQVNTNPAPAPAPTNNTGGGGYSAPAPDPYAQWGGRAGYDKLINSFNSQKSDILGLANTKLGAGGTTIGGGIADLLDSLKQGQNKVDTQAMQNELAKNQGTQGVLGMVGRGIKSGGVMLANKNAGDSSGAEAIARAYGTLGRTQLSGVGNQYAQGQSAVDKSQTDLGVARTAGIRHTNEAKTNLVNQVVAETQQSLNALHAAMNGASLGDKINIQNEIDAVRNNAVAQLQQYDQTLQSGLSGINPSSAEDRRKQAQALATAGTAPENAFNYQTQAPAQFQNSGPFASALPLFTYQGRKQTG